LLAKLTSSGRGQTEDNHPGDLKNAKNYHMLHERDPKGKCLGRWRKRSSIVDPGNVKGT